VEFVADESCDFNVVRVLRSAGYDVVAICEESPGLSDAEVAKLTISEGRALLTEDRDFGEFVHAHDVKIGTVLYLRFPMNARSRLPDAIIKLLREQGEQLRGAFVTVEPGRYRIHRIPSQ